MAVLHKARVLLPLAGLLHLCHRMAVHCMARVLPLLAWVNSSLLSYGRTPYGASIIDFGLGYLNLGIVWMYDVRREYYCLWPGLIHFFIIWLYLVWREYYCLWPALPQLCHNMAAHCVARV